MILNSHHLFYHDQNEHTLNVPAKFHTFISMIQNMKATPELYTLLVNCQHALNYEAYRVLRELDNTGDDLRVRKIQKKEKCLEELKNINKYRDKS